MTLHTFQFESVIESIPMSALTEAVEILAIEAAHADVTQLHSWLSDKLDPVPNWKFKIGNWQDTGQETIVNWWLELESENPAVLIGLFDKWDSITPGCCFLNPETNAPAWPTFKIELACSGRLEVELRAKDLQHARQSAIAHFECLNAGLEGLPATVTRFYPRRVNTYIWNCKIKNDGGRVVNDPEEQHG